jgi:ribonucleoside-triphosphate reductase (thioredoxin)
MVHAMRMYDKIFNMKFLPPGRGLWAMGTKLTQEKQVYAALNNCAFVSTDAEDVDGFVRAFEFLMDSAMLGVGVGFDTKGKGRFRVFQPQGSATVVVEDTREAWVESLALLLKSYLMPNQKKVEFDYSKVRPAGTPLKTFGGVSGGPGPLVDLHATIQEMFAKQLEAKSSGEVVMGTRQIVDLMNLIGKCVVSGNIRRTAEIAFGEYDDEEFINLKNYEMHPERMAFGWVSNNSIFAKVG